MILALDKIILNFLYDNFSCPVLDKIMVFITWLGNIGWIWIAAALLFILFKKHRELGIIMILSLLLALLVGNALMKPLFQRERPFINAPQINLLISAPADYSFPSGHAFSSFAAATVIWLYKKRWGIYAVTLAALISFSRLYLYVHYPTDVLAGIILGICAAIASYKIYVFKRGFQCPPSLTP